MSTLHREYIKRFEIPVSKLPPSSWQREVYAKGQRFYGNPRDRELLSRLQKIATAKSAAVVAEEPEPSAQLTIASETGRVALIEAA